MNFFTGKTYLITGASMGIGESLVRELSSRGAKLILVARSVDRLETLKGELKGEAASVTVLPCDLSHSDKTEELIGRVREGFLSLDGLILNAGIGFYGEFLDTPEADIREIFEVNFFSNLSLLRGLIPLLKKGNSPSVTMVSSIVGWRAIPRMAAYSASKGALDLFAEALRIELKAHGIRTILTYPGGTRTPFSQNAKSSGWRPTIDRRWIIKSPEFVAGRIIRAIEQGKRDEFVSLTNRVVRWGNFLFPKLFDWALEKYFKNQGK